MKKLIMAMLLACAIPSRAQEGMNDPRVRRLMELNAIPMERRTSAQLEDSVQLMLALMIDELVKAVPEPDKVRLEGLHTVLRPGEGSSPVIVRGRQIWVSEDYLATLYALAILLTHDLAVTRFEPFETPNPLLDQPFANSALVPLMAPLRAHVESPFFADRLALLQCPPSDRGCRDLLITSLGSMFAFILSHEIAHVLLGHAEQDVHPLEEELEADARAWHLAQRLLADLHTGEPSFDETARLAFLASPLLSLQYELLDERGSETPGIARRRDALLARIPEDEREEVAELLFPQRSDENAGRLQLSWSQTPQRLWIDGVELPPAEVDGRELLVAGGLHHIFAWSPEGMAYERAQAGGARRTVHLRFQRLAESPASPEDLRKLERERRWFDLLLQTSDAALKPRKKDLLVLHAEALRSLDLTDLIEVPSDGSVPAGEMRKLRTWKRTGTPLLFWQ